jgi:predicted transglutaminase-like cysteine proteinase
LALEYFHTLVANKSKRWLPKVPAIVLSIWVGIIAACATPDIVADPASQVPPPDTYISHPVNNWPFQHSERSLDLSTATPQGLFALQDIVATPFIIPEEWELALQGFKEMTPVEQMITVTSVVNEIPYVGENQDTWRHPNVFLSEGGDCDCYAIAKYALLRQLGYAANDLRLTIVRRLSSNTLHMVLVVKTGEKQDRHLILDSANHEVRSAKYSSFYEPYLSINEIGVWLHREIPNGVLDRLLNPVYKNSS